MTSDKAETDTRAIPPRAKSLVEPRTSNDAAEAGPTSPGSGSATAPSG